MLSTRISVLILIFGLSGFSGLIYQSIWANYLKLFLGHSAYSQSLVLAIFMGGMAVGSWGVARHIEKIRQPIRWYAGIEAVIGVFGLIFHLIYIGAAAVVNDHLIDGLESELLIDIVKWSVASGLILPQSVLLGCTFPLLAAGLVRYSKSGRGRIVSLLYFSNSLGAVFGVLISGFVLISQYGLPGTVMVAGAINLWLAVLVWVLNRKWEMESGAEVKSASYLSKEVEQVGRRLLGVLLVVAGLTGMASFFYELGWIRMLTMVLGSSTHSFELMLSGFILGLAIGGFWIKDKIDQLDNPMATLGRIQLAMGTLAALSLFVYDKTYLAMSILMNALSNTDYGYLLFNVSSHLIVILLMLPATICAGMTLPLVTTCLMRSPAGERSIGWVYAANTLGGIVGVIFVVHFVMPLLGLKSVILVGAAIDILLGIVLLVYTSRHANGGRFVLSAGAACGVLAAVMIFFQIDPQKTASAVYRTGNFRSEVESLARLDGKTASIDVYTVGEGEKKRQVIATNGKPDASISVGGGDRITSDELTMVFAAALPLSMHDSPKKVANIGIGAGLTSHVILGDRRVDQLDSIEIEPKMAEGAKLFGEMVSRTFSDPRSNIYFQDAKTFFYSKNDVYDIIISEPSNPWVSGVATLFSKEFYGHVIRQLAEDGLFVQWLHLYEMDDQVIASVMKALGGVFNHYVVYSSNTVDILIVASKSRKALNIQHDVFEDYTDPGLLKRVGLENLNDIKFPFSCIEACFGSFFLTAFP